MQLKVILNRMQKHSSFQYGDVSFFERRGRDALKIRIHPRKNGRTLCSICQRPAPLYDTLKDRLFEHVPLWGLLVFFVYTMRRVRCTGCGIRVEHVPWAQGKQSRTLVYSWFLARWAKILSWSQVADAFHTSWESVYRSVEMAVTWGRLHINLENIKAIGIDEIAWKTNHKYFTVVYQLDEGMRRLIWIGEERRKKTLEAFFDWFGQEQINQLQYICTDMWRPYLDTIKARAPATLNILDRFHIVQHLNKAIDKIRSGEAKRMAKDGHEPVLRKSRWLFLKHPSKRTKNQDLRLKEILNYNLRTVRAYFLKEDFQSFWDYKSPSWAGRFLDRWCAKVMRSKLEPMKDVARMLRNHRSLILNWFHAKGTMSSGVVEGLNRKAKLTSRMAYGFKSADVAETALHHALGKLPEPEFTHRFC